MHASQIAKRAETLTGAPSRGAKCNFPSPPEGLRPSRRLPSGPPPGHPNSLKIALARAVCAKVRARAPLNAKKRTFGGPRVPKGAQMDPKWEQMGAQNVLKSKVSRKSADSGLDPLFTVYSHCRHPPKPYFFTPRSHQNARLFRVVPRMRPRGCKMAPPGPKNGESGVPRAP